MIILVSIFEASNLFLWLFVTCDLCQRITNAFNEIDDVIGRFDWYLFSNEINQRNSQLLLHASEVFHVIGKLSKRLNSVESIKCYYPLLRNNNLISFLSQMIRTTYKYFTVLREFGKWDCRCLFLGRDLKQEI